MIKGQLVEPVLYKVMATKDGRLAAKKRKALIEMWIEGLSVTKMIDTVESRPKILHMIDVGAKQTEIVVITGTEV